MSGVGCGRRAEHHACLRERVGVLERDDAGDYLHVAGDRLTHVEKCIRAAPDIRSRAFHRERSARERGATRKSRRADVLSAPRRRHSGRRWRRS